MDVREFEALKKKQEELQLKKAKEETRLETLEKELESLRTQLEELGITDLNEAEELLDKKEKELQEQYDNIMSLLKKFE